MQLFFTDHTDGNNAFLDLRETRHCKVLRKNVGDEIQVINGNGLIMTCIISRFLKDSTELQITGQTHFPRPRPYYFHLYIAPTKQNERMEWMLEKTIEIGLDEITFIETSHSEKSQINMPRLQKIAVSSITQSGQYYLPIINSLKSLNQIQIDENTLIAFCGKGDKKGIMETVYPIINNSVISILIGPEGDFSDIEVADMLKNGAKIISLGNSRLRTETAALYCAVMLNGLS